MKTVPARVGPPYPDFKPGDIVIPNSDYNKTLGLTWEEYSLNTTYVVVEVEPIEWPEWLTVKRLKDGTSPTGDCVKASRYRLATAEEIAAALAKRIIGDRLPETMQVLADAMASQLHWTSEIIRHMGPSIPGAGQKIEDIKAAVEDEFKKAFCK